MHEHKVCSSAAFKAFLLSTCRVSQCYTIDQYTTIKETLTVYPKNDFCFVMSEMNVLLILSVSRGK